MINSFKKINESQFKNLIILGIFLFAFIINQIYGNRGLFPHDSASHFDNGFRILNGQHPVKDFWIISGFIVDYIQSLLFFIFGTNWQIYVAHASLFNSCLTIFLLFFFKSIGLNFLYSAIICISFSILAYPSSGTPFVDHHSSFFSLTSFICLILAYRGKNKIFWFFTPIFLSLAILSKAVPALYFAMVFGIFLIFYIIKTKDFISLKYFILGSFTSFIILILILTINKISITNFFIQNFLYPQTIGTQRYKNLLNIDLLGIISQYKFIFLFNILLIFLFIKNRKIFNILSEIEIILFIIITLIFIFHQILTKNQIFINFLLPLQAGYILLFLNDKKIFRYFLIFFLIALTLKYHIRFNHERKFHELNSVNFDQAVPASKIDKSLSGLKWITPEFSNSPSLEVEKILRIKEILSNEENFILMSNYSFLSVVLKKETNSPTRWFTFDGTDFPRGKNKYKKKYIKLLKKIIKENKINKLFIIKPVTVNEVYDYIDRECFKYNKDNNIIIELEVLNCSNN